MASTAPSTLPKAVTSSTGVSTAFFTTQSSTSSPSASTMRMSLTTASKPSPPRCCSSRRSFSASAPSVATTTWWPSSPRICAMSPREAMSSTTRMRASSPMRSSLTRVCLQEDRNLRLVRPSLRDSEHQLYEVIRIGDQLEAVEAEERDRADEPGSFVAVDERVVANEMEQVRRGHLVQGGMEPLSAEPRLRHRQRGREQCEVPDAGFAAVP